jgi:hypothetical protein
MRLRRSAIAEAADYGGVVCLVSAGWAFNTILGLALAGVGLLVIGAVMDK